MPDLEIARTAASNYLQVCVTKHSMIRSLGCRNYSFGDESAGEDPRVLSDRVRIESMTFARQAGTAVLLVTLTLWLQCGGIAVLIHWARASIERGMARLSALHAAGLMIRFSVKVVVLHFPEIFFWAVFYRLYCLPSWEPSFYFSAASFSTVGYGDVVLPRIWRLLGPIESVTGVLMCGISVSCLFAVATRLIERESGAPPIQYGSGSPSVRNAELENVAENNSF